MSTYRGELDDPVELLASIYIYLSNLSTFQYPGNICRLAMQGQFSWLAGEEYSDTLRAI